MECRGARLETVVAGQGQLVAGQQAQRRTVDADSESEFVPPQFGPAGDLDHRIAKSVQPATAVRCHGEGRGVVEQLPTAAIVDEKTQAMTGEQGQIAASAAEQPVVAGVPLGELRVEDTGGPHRRGQHRLVGQPGGTAAQDVAVRPQQLPLLGVEGDVLAAVGKEREQRGAVGFGMMPAGAEAGREQCLVGFAGLQAGRRGKEAGRLRACGWGADGGGWRSHRQHCADAAEVEGRAGGGVICLEAGEEGDAGVISGAYGKRSRLQGNHAVFVLEPVARQVPVGQGGRAAAPRYEQLSAIGGEAGSAVAAAAQQPGMASGDGKVLAAGDHRATDRMIERLMVDVLAGVVLVGADGGARRQSDIEDLDDVDAPAFAASVAQRYRPEPAGAATGDDEVDLIVEFIPYAADRQFVGHGVNFPLAAGAEEGMQEAGAVTPAQE